MKSLLLSKQAKIVVDILLLLGIIQIIHSDKSFTNAATIMDFWLSSHAISGILWISLIVIHIWQHWPLTKSFIKKKVILRNKITALTIMAFILISLSILLMVIGITDRSIKFHNIISHIVLAVVIIHIIQKSKRFVSLFKHKRN